MPHRAVVIGAGMGGLAAAIRLAQRGCDVTVFEARDEPGGLASGVSFEGFDFDGGPYVLLDRPGLEWAFQQLKQPLDNHVSLQRIPSVYQVAGDDDAPVTVHDSLEQTAGEFESRWPGSGDRYRSFVQRTRASYERLQPLQWTSRPGVVAVMKSGAWRDVPFILSSLRSVLKRTQLPPPVVNALGIWTHVAGQTLQDAPSPLALVPSMIHHAGAWRPAGGIRTIPRALFRIAEQAGVRFRLATRVARIDCKGGRVVSVTMKENDSEPADSVISNIGLGTYLNLLDDNAKSALPHSVHESLSSLPLQSPGVCAYLAVKGTMGPPFLRFRLADEPDGCRLLVTPGVLDSSIAQDGWFPARLIVPMQHARAENGGETRQQEFLQRVLEERWWRERFDDVRVLSTRTPSQWGGAFHLFRNSMNPVMTATFMLAGRLAHRSRWIRGLYLTGSATHPGQWVSFCAVSGILAADLVQHDREAAL